MIVNQVRYQITQEQGNQYVSNCLFIFFLQVILSILVGLQIFSKDFEFTMGDYSVFISRFICALMLHMRLEIEVRQSLNMIRYLINHSAQFTSTMVPFLVAHMQLFASLLTEIINICLICGQKTIMDSIINFIALGAISEIDNYYAVSLNHLPIKKAAEEPYPFMKRLYYLRLSKMSCQQILLRSIYKFYRVVYVSLYFYFTPYITTVFSYLAASNASKK